ncbi:MAG: hypothetical protein H6756_06420 [Candidatus Omnitrophica bacterium]|nr:hypothetical protein [Candidatus Omnitrophota bacterium]
MHSCNHAVAQATPTQSIQRVESLSRMTLPRIRHPQFTDGEISVKQAPPRSQTRPGQGSHCTQKPCSIQI